MAIICRDYKLLFIMVYGTGCSAIGKELQERLNGEYLPHEDIVRGGRKLLGRKHNSVAQLLRYGAISERELSDYLIFGTVRNPFDSFTTQYERLVGTWMHHAMSNSDPAAWVNRNGKIHAIRLRSKQFLRMHWASMLGFDRWVYSRLGKWQAKSLIESPFRSGPANLRRAYPLIEGVNMIVRYENLEADFNKVLQAAGVSEHVQLPKYNVTPGKKSYKEYYSPRLRDYMEKYLREELEVYGYSFEGLRTENHQ